MKGEEERKRGGEKLSAEYKKVKMTRNNNDEQEYEK